MDWEGVADPGEIGGGDHPSEDPPELSEHDEFCLLWFGRYCSSFAKDYGLMPFFFQALETDTDEASLLLYKLNLIYQTSKKIWKRKAERENA